MPPSMVTARLLSIVVPIAQATGGAAARVESPRHWRVVAVLLAAVLLVSIVSLINRRRLREEYAALWLITGFGIMLLAIFKGALEAIAGALHISPPSTALFFFGLLFVVMLCLEFSVRISRQSQQLDDLDRQVIRLEAERGGGPMPGVPPKLFFVHIPKAAGTSLHRILRKNYPRGSLHTVVDAGVSMAVLQRLSPDRKRRIRVVKGHMPFGQHVHFEEPHLYVTVVRDPVDRIVSLYHHARRTGPRHYLHEAASRMSLAELVRADVTQETRDHQTRFVAGEEDPNCPLGQETLARAIDNLERRFAVVGVTDRFDETLVLFRRRLGWRTIAHLPLNVGDAGQRAALDPDAVEAIRERNALDLELYAAAKRLFEEAIAAEDASFADEVARFRKAQRRRALLARPLAPAIRAAEGIARRGGWLRSWYLGD